MYKIIGILLLIFVSAGCSVFQPVIKSERKSSSEADWITLEQLVVKQNITSQNFFINKARVEISSNDVKENFLASVKFIYPDTFLISLRSKSGIEAARIFCTKDTILINDRINRRLLFGKPGIAGRKYGITAESLPVVLGDLINDSSKGIDIECVNGTATLYTALDGSKIRYVLDCAKAKVISASKENSNNSTIAVIKFGKFIRNADFCYPSDINIEYSEMRVNIKVDKLEYPWAGNIKFIHGSNYELIELL